MLHILEGEMDTGIHRHFYWNLDVLLNLLLEHGAARPSHCWPSLPAPPTGWPRAQSSSAAARVEVQPLCPLRVVIRPEPEYMDRCYRRPTLSWMWGVQELKLQDNGWSCFICNYLQSAPNVQNQPTLDCTARPTDVSAGVSRRAGWRVQEKKLERSQLEIFKSLRLGSCKRGQIISDFLKTNPFIKLKVSQSDVRATRSSKLLVTGLSL